MASQDAYTGRFAVVRPFIASALAIGFVVARIVPARSQEFNLSDLLSSPPRSTSEQPTPFEDQALAPLELPRPVMAETILPGIATAVDSEPSEAGATDADDSPQDTPRNGAAADQSQPRFDAAEVARGQSAFQTACTQCHDADRALQKTKSLSGWLATVRRMARMDGADIDEADIRPIATYLTSLNPSVAVDAGEARQGRSPAAEEGEQTLSFSTTVSTLFRGGNDNLENPGFFPDIWLRADWQPRGPLRGRVTACTSCHSDQTGNGGFTLELVEATAHFDLLYWLRERYHGPDPPKGEVDIEIKAGRFVVPFGAFAAMSHPGVYRTVTNPLMFNMGRRVNVDFARQPVLPMPYSDEGVDLVAQVPLLGDFSATLDAYAINGLQGFGPGIQFTPSRSYTDNNKNTAAGGRATVGNRFVRFGGSVMSGQMQDEGSPELNYHFAGGDVTARYEDVVRLYYEYAMRRNDADFGDGQVVYGNVVEAELLVLHKPKISLLARYDDLKHRDASGRATTDRFTWGVNTTLPGGSLLILNHERWRFPDEEPKVDVFGFRWVVAF